MKNKRLITIFLLVLVMLFAVTISVQANEEDASYIKGRFFMQAFGIDTQGMDYNSAVTRGFAANVLSKTLFDDIVITPAMTKFVDVAPDSPYASAAYLLSSAGVMQGDGSRFSPNDKITYSQAAKIFVSSIGKDVVAASKGGYPSGYITVATNDRIFDNVVVKTDDALTFGDFAKMFYNFTYCRGFVTSAGDLKTYSLDDTTVLENKLSRCDMTYIEGVVRGNQFGSVKDDDIGYITIENASYALACDVDSDIIGYYANAFLTKKGSKYAVTSIIKDPSMNVVKVLSGADIADVSLSKVKYYDGDKIRELKLNELSVVRNSKVLASYTKNDLIPLNGGIVLIDNDADGKYEYVNVQNKQYYTVQRTSASNNVIILDEGNYEGSTHIYINPEDNEFYHRIYKSNGEEATFSDIKESDVIRIEGSIEQKVLCVYIIDTVIDGTVETIAVDDEYPLTIDGKYYKVATDVSRQALVDVPSLGFNSSYTFTVDGALVVKTEKIKSKESYAYVIDTYVSNGLTTKISYKIVGEDKQIYYGDVADRITYNGKSVKKENFTPKSGIVISYKTDSDGKICVINDGELYSEKSTKIYAEKTGILYSYSYTYPLFMSDETVVFIVPDSGKDDDYMSDLTLTNGTSYICESYDYDEDDMSVGAVVIYEDVTYESPGYIAKNSPVCILKSRTSVLDEEGIQVFKLEWLEGEEVKTALVKNTANMRKIAGNMACGDVFQYSVTNRGYIDNITTLIRLDQNPKYFHNGANSNLEQVYGKVVDSQYKTLPKGNMAKFVNVYTLNVGLANERNFLVTSDETAVNYYYYDSKTGAVQPGSFDNVMTEDGVLGTFSASEVYIYYCDRSALAVVIKN